MPHADILDQHDSLRNPLLGSVALHAGLAGLAILYATVLVTKHDSFGSAAAGGGAIEIGAVSTIPLPSHTGRPNPIANPTESQAPLPPPEKVQHKEIPKPEPNAVPLGRQKLKPQPQEQPKRKWTDNWAKKANQVYSTEGPALSNPMYQMRGGGSIGVGPGVFGERFGAYAALIAQRVAQQWQTAGLDPRSQAQPAMVTFDIQRDGSVSNVFLMQRSGNFTIDASAQRAIIQAGPFPPLPAGFGRSSATVELTFNLR